MKREKSCGAVIPNQKSLHFFHALYAAPFSSLLRCYSFSRVFYLLHASQLSFLIAMGRNSEERAPPFIFHSRWSSILVYIGLCPPCFLPTGWVFISFTSSGQAHPFLLSRTHSFSWFKLDFCSFTLLVFHCKNAHSKSPQRAINFCPSTNLLEPG